MKRITIDGKEYPYRVTMGAMLRFKQETGRDIGQIQPDDVGDLVTFLWCCIVSACKADRVEFGMELIDFADSLDPDTLNGFFKEMEGDGAEKKTRPTTS